ALLLFLAAGATVAYRCFVDATADPSPELAQRDGSGAPPRKERDRVDDPAVAPVPETPDATSEGSVSPATPETRPAPPPRVSKDTEPDKRRPKDALPADSLIGFNRPAAKAHPEQKRINAAIDKGV